MPNTMIVNVPPYAGEYEFDIAGRMLNVDEWEWVHKISGYLPLTFDEGVSGGDPRLYVAFAVIAMNRAGVIQDDEVMGVAALLRKAPVDGASITFRGDVDEADEEEESDPPAGSESDETPSSGDDSSEPSEPSPESGTPPATGLLGSETTSDSDRLTLAR